MNLFANLKLRWKLISIVLIPLACTLYLAQGNVTKNSELADENKKLLQLSRYAVFASSLVHEMQKERGASAGFMGSKGKKFVSELPAQRKNTNEKSQALENFLADFDPESYGEEFAQRLENALALQTQLQDKRQAISGFNISAKEAIGYYTSINSAFLNTIASIAKISSGAELGNMASAYINFLQSKERAGVERAVMAGTFAQNYFSPGVYDRFKSLVTVQDVYMDVFRSLATPDQLTFFTETLRGKHISETLNMRQKAIEHAAKGDFGVDATHWFNMQTGKINLLKKVEDKLSNDLESLANNLTEQANNALTASTTLMIVALSLTLAFVYIVQRLITKPISNAVTFANAIAEGRLDNNINSDARDESGQLLCALKSMQEKLLQSQTDLQKQMDAERLQMLESNRVRQALDNVTANVMMADNDLNITYTNDAVKAMFRDYEGEIQKDLSAFSVDKLIGTNIDVFHKKPSHQRGLLKALEKTYVAQMNVGGRTFKIITNPVSDEQGQRLGTVVEWVDLTEQLDTENQIEGVINAAVAGKLDARLNADRFNGFMGTLATSINHLLDTIIAPLNVSSNYMERIAIGDIPDPITDDYHGDFNKIKNNLNTCIASIKHLADDTNELANAAVAGQLSTRAEETRHQGDFRKIINGVNNALDAIVNPINECKEVMTALSQGDLTLNMQGQYEGDFKELKNAINNSLNNLLEVVTQVSESATNVDTSSTEIASGVSDLSQRTESQAASLEETAASMEEITSTVNNNADNAQSADQLAREAQDKAQEGGNVVEQTIESMGDINQASKKITDIISVIDELAFQTNLLALNAAVEAARAGEQGRGFAVVASEVRSLAQRSADAAGEIKDLIHDSVKKVEVGSNLVNQSGETLNEIVSAVQKVCEMIGTISTASAEQRSGISQVSDTISHIDGMTQQNAALVEEASAASASMSEQASYMQGLLSKFKTHG